jgi:Rieske 2Fe-2S family protein
MPDDGKPLSSLVANRLPWHSLDAAFYTDPAIFETDLDVIFGRHWIYVGVEPDVPEPGDCMVVDIGRNSILIVRDDDEGVRAFHNVCRHRGAKLVQQPKTSVGNIVCPYHQWTYGVDGTLRFAEHMAADFDRSCHGLKPIHLKSVAGLLFICLSDNPPDDIDEMAAALAPYLAPHDLPNAKVVKEIDLIELGNWKLTMENNRECYHCASSHPELTVSLFEYGFGFDPNSGTEARRELAKRYQDLVGQCHVDWEKNGLPSREIDHLDDRPTGYRTERLPLDGTGESQTLNTARASKKLLGTLTDAKLGGLSMWTQPNSWHHFMADHIVTFSVIPLEPERTLLRTKWLVHKDAVEGVDYDINNITAVWEATNKQDGQLVGMAQAGARTSGYEPGPYSPFTEGLVEKFAAWYINRLKAHQGA